MRGTSEIWWELERPGLTRPVRIDPTGERGPTRGQSRGKAWRTTSRGLVVPSHVELTTEQRIVEAAAVTPRGTGVTGWAALRWAGGFWFDGLAADGQTELPVTLAVGDSRIVQRSGIQVSEEQLRPYDLTQVDGLPLTAPLRSTTFLMRHAPTLVEAVTAIDMAAYNDLVSVEEVVDYQQTMPAWTGIALCRKASAYADENSWSPREVRMRLTWVLHAGLPPPMCNRPIFDRWGHHLGTPDLLDEEAGVICEYNGALHLARSQRRKDRDREEVFRQVGLEVVEVLAGDDDSVVAARMVAARDRARWQATAARDWTTMLPSWWVPTFTVAQRRDLDPSSRERLLRLRRTA